MNEAREQAQTDGYVECSECGHDIEQHDMTACYAVMGCWCTVRWSAREIQLMREELGLLAQW